MNLKESQDFHKALTQPDLNAEAALVTKMDAQLENSFLAAEWAAAQSHPQSHIPQ